MIDTVALAARAEALQTGPRPENLSIWSRAIPVRVYSAWHQRRVSWSWSVVWIMMLVYPLGGYEHHFTHREKQEQCRGRRG